MSVFEYPFGVGTPGGSRFDQIDGLVDTGSAYTWVPGSILERLGVPRAYRRPFQLADGRIVDRELGQTWVRLDGQTLIRLVVFGDEGSRPLIGADTLQGFSLAADPVNHRLVPVPGLAVTPLDPRS